MTVPLGFVAEYTRGDPDDDSFQLFSSPVVWMEPRTDAADGKPPFVGWVVEDGVPSPADALEGFTGYGWRMPVVTALPGRGWKIRFGDGETQSVEMWLVRGDGEMAAAVVDGAVTKVVDPREDEVEFVEPGWKAAK